jgi:hypothetical protein
MSWLISIALFILAIVMKDTIITNNTFLIASGIFAVAGSISYVGNCIKHKNDTPKD